ncbi:MAG: LPS export ABC transporter periplasmic protein LptC [Thermosynechococcaceae cyanobacterium]
MPNFWRDRNVWGQLGHIGFVAFGLMLMQLNGCSWRAPTPSGAKSKPVQGGVQLSNVVLAQTDTKGQLLWKFKAEGVSYGDNQQVATAKAIRGQLYDAGKPIFDVAAENGTLQQSNQQLQLKGNLQVMDRQRKLTFRGRSAQWNPKSGLLQVRNGLSAVSPKVQLWADNLQATQRGREIRVSGKVVMETRDRRIRLKTQQAIWHVDQQRFQAGTAAVNGQQPSVEIERLGSPTDKAIALAGEAQADLKSGIVTLSNPVRVQLGQSPLTLTSQALTWDTVRQRIFTQTLLQLEDPQHHVSILANQGTLDQTQNRITLQGKVEVTRSQNPARLTSDELNWNTQTQRIEAQGNVHYVQTSPPFDLRGPNAVGKIAEQTLQINGGNVVTEIIP